MKRRVVIIGGGLGGLFTGAILAKEGLEICVLEKNATIGGGLQSFVRFGEVFDTGMHVIGGMQPGGNIYRLCQYLGIDARACLSDVNPDCTDRLYYAEDKRSYIIAGGREGFIECLAGQFPEERENLVRYMDAIYRLADEMSLFMLRPAEGDIFSHSDEFQMAADAFIAQYISDRRLRSILAYLNPMYSGRADMTPAYVHAIISYLYIQGPSRFVGGSHVFANLLGDFIRQHGGEIHVADGVCTIRTEGRNVTGVVTTTGKVYVGDYYVSDVHPCTTIGLFDDPKVFPKSYRNRLDSIQNSYSAFTLSIKLKPQVLRYMNYTCYYSRTYDGVWYFYRHDSEWPNGFMYMTPPNEHQGEYATKMMVTAPMAWEYVKEWGDSTVGHRPQSYVDWKQMMADRLLVLMEEVIPGIRDMVEAVNTASPLTIRDYYATKEGGMCGFAKDCHNLALTQVPVFTKVPNLLLTGQNNNLHGFCGVALTAIQTSEAILGMNYIVNKINETTAADN